MASSCLHPSMRMRDRCKGPASCCRNLRFRQRGSRSLNIILRVVGNVKGLLAEQVEPVAEELAESHGSDGNRVAQRVVHNDVELGHERSSSTSMVCGVPSDGIICTSRCQLMGRPCCAISCSVKRFGKCVRCSSITKAFWCCRPARGCPRSLPCRNSPCRGRPRWPRHRCPQYLPAHPRW